MDYKEISEKLEELGYATQYHNLINSLTVGIPENGNFKLDSIFRIEKNGDKMNVNYFTGQIPVRKNLKPLKTFLSLLDKFFQCKNN
ncbi:hypothetical protein [Chryseobacterium sp. 2987]|uniref:hypothetical protein n=1 Tax=Chryseobacterium sp. 2987 TaxID=2817767 RepID=UPI0028563228|nr:hypothetical protein [Chryseobacterium sp. 2987]MDR6921316.1 hypothetical protein [Chryseobacterium sp. 2987]